MENIKLVGDTFHVYDLGIPMFGKNDKNASITGIKYNSIFIPEANYLDNKKQYSIRYNLYRIAGCHLLREDLKKILDNKPEDLHMGYINSVNIPNEVYDRLCEISLNLDLGFIMINGIKIDLTTYEPDGEYFEVVCDNSQYNLNSVKKYYSIIDGQYTLFLADGTIRSFSNVKEIKMSKDVRLTKEELERL